VLKDGEFLASQGYIGKPCLKNKKKTKTNREEARDGGSRL
jgi:hypothetical protein